MSHEWNSLSSVFLFTLVDFQGILLLFCFYHLENERYEGKLYWLLHLSLYSQSLLVAIRLLMPIINIIIEMKDILSFAILESLAN